MQLNHLNLSVIDVRETKAFLVEYFGLTDGGGNANIGFLRDDNEMVLTLTSMKVGGESEVRYPATFHIGFIQEDEGKVNMIYDRLVVDGYAPPAPSRQHGSWTFYFLAPGGFVIEVLG